MEDFGDTIDDVSGMQELPDAAVVPQDENLDEPNLGGAIADLPAKKKRTIHTVNLNTNRLLGKRGLGALPKIGEKIKFKGKGHEIENLNLLMGTMEHWAHRLMPRMNFDNSLHQIERLGMKRPVQTYIAKLRMGMPLEDEDFTSAGQEKKEGENVDFDSGHDRFLESGEINMDDTSQMGPCTGDSVYHDLINATWDDATELSPVQSIREPTKVHTDLTDEQRRRMAENKQKAMELRAQRLSMIHKTSNPALVLGSTQNSRVENIPPAQESGQKETMDLFDDELNPQQLTIVVEAPDSNSEDKGDHCHDSMDASAQREDFAKTGEWENSNDGMRGVCFDNNETNPSSHGAIDNGATWSNYGGAAVEDNDIVNPALKCDINRSSRAVNLSNESHQTNLNVASIDVIEDIATDANTLLNGDNISCGLIKENCDSNCALNGSLDESVDELLCEVLDNSTANVPFPNVVISDDYLAEDDLIEQIMS